MRWNALPTVLIPALAISALAGLASSSACSQSASQQGIAPAPKLRAVITFNAPVPSAQAIQMHPNLPRPPVLPVIGGVPSPLEAGLAPVLGEPYSAIQTTTTLVNSKLLMKQTTRLFRDRQGRTRVERTVPTNTDTESPPVILTVTINDPVSAQEYILEPQGKIARVAPLQASLATTIQPPVTPPVPTGVPPWGLPGVEESKPTPLGQKFIHGIAVVGTRMEDSVTFADREPETLVIDQWFSPELGVAMLRTHQGGGIDFTQRLEHLVRGEPDPTLFTIPPDYTRSEAPTHPAPH